MLDITVTSLEIPEATVDEEKVHATSIISCMVSIEYEPQKHNKQIHNPRVVSVSLTTQCFSKHNPNLPNTVK